VPAAVLAGLAAAEPAMAKMKFYEGKPTDAIPAADKIQDAAQVLTDSTYPFMSEVDWNSLLFLAKPGGSATAIDWLKAIDTALVMGNAMDSELLKKGVEAHIKGISHVNKAGVPEKQDLKEMYEYIGKMVASVPESKTMAVYDSFSKLVGADVPPYLMSTVDKSHAEAAYAGLMKFKDVVKANPISHGETGSAAISSGIKDAAAKLSSASYPLIKEIDWTSDLFVKPLPGASAKDYLKGVDAALKMSVAMDPAALHGAVEAHHKAIAGVDAKGIPSQADYEAINAALGQLIASVPASKTMAVYDAFARIITPDVGKLNMALVNSGDAKAAYSALMDFKDVVKATR